jgi:allantoin racemase
MTEPARIWYQSFTDPDVDAPYFTRLRGYLQSIAAIGYEVHPYGLHPGDRFLHPISEFRCAAQVISGALTAEREGYDAFLIGHFQEPALSETRAAVQIPVIGLGEASMLHACTLGRKIALVTINPVFVPYHEQQISRHGLERRVVAVRAINAQVEQLNVMIGMLNASQVRTNRPALQEESMSSTPASCEGWFPTIPTE